MSNRKWKLFIEDILKSIKLVQSYTENMDFNNLKNNIKTIDAVVRNFKIIDKEERNILK